jgi:hypothetical protein
VPMCAVLPHIRNFSRNPVQQVQPMNAVIRCARPDDIPAMVALSEQKRIQYQEYQPLFWRKAADSKEKQLPFFERLVASEQTIVLVHEQVGLVDGFVIAALVDAPPVYDPGGKTCLIDDFAVADAAIWETAGAALLAEACREGKARGAVQSVVVCGHRDEPKRAMLAAAGLSIASEWYVGALSEASTREVKG